MKRFSYSVVSVLGVLGLAVLGAACGQADSSATASADPAKAPSGKASGGTQAGASGDSVGSPECDEVLKKATACKDKPGMAAIVQNRENWKAGIANAATKDATITACKSSMEAVKAVGCDGGAASGPAGSGSGAPAASGAAGAADSVGAPECDDILAKATACKDKPGMSAITMNRENWKRGLEVAASRDATITACKAAAEALKAVGCDGGPAGSAGGASWDGKAPYSCTGNETATLTGVTANITAGPAINASGNCKLTLKDCNITTDKGVAASGNAQVTLEGGEIKASNTAIDASGNAQVTANNAKVSGKVNATGNAKVTGVPVTK